MKRILFMIVPLIIAMLAFRPVIPLNGAGTPVKGTSNAATYSSDGSFSITVANKNSNLVFSTVGFQAKEIKTNDQAIISVFLSSAEAGTAAKGGQNFINRKELR